MTHDLTFFTNEPDGSLLGRFKATLKDVQFFDVLVGYFRTSGFKALADAFASVEKIRILVGMNVDAETFESIERAQQIELDFESHQQTQTAFSDTLVKELEGAPETGAWEGALRFEVHYPVLPGSILTRLIVRMHRHVKATDGGRCAWRTGVVLTSEGNAALVRADLTAHRMHIAVRGPGPGRRDLLTGIEPHRGYHTSSLPSDLVQRLRALADGTPSGSACQGELAALADAVGGSLV